MAEKYLHQIPEISMFLSSLERDLPEFPEKRKQNVILFRKKFEKLFHQIFFCDFFFEKKKGNFCGFFLKFELWLLGQAALAPVGSQVLQSAVGWQIGDHSFQKNVASAVDWRPMRPEVLNMHFQSTVKGKTSFGPSGQI